MYPAAETYQAEDPFLDEGQTKTILNGRKACSKNRTIPAFIPPDATQKSHTDSPITFASDQSSPSSSSDLSQSIFGNQSPSYPTHHPATWQPIGSLLLF